MLFLIIGIFIGILGSTNPSASSDNLGFTTNPSPKNTSTESRAGQYKLINQLYECNISEVESTKEVGNLEKEVNNLITKQMETKLIKTASVYYRDLNTGPNFGIKEKDLFAPSSLLKVPVMIAFLNKAEDEPDILNKKIKYIKPLTTIASLPQNYKPTKPLKTEEEYTVWQLIEQMIVESDNQALDLLRNEIGEKAINKVTLDLEIPTALTIDSDNLLRVKDYSTLFRVLYNASYLDKQSSEKALELLSKINFKRGLVAPIPANITVAHKFGERSYDDGTKQLHDCGIVYYPNRPYLLCIMTKGDNFNNLEQTIQQISKTVYQEIDRRYK